MLGVHNHEGCFAPESYIIPSNFDPPRCRVISGNRVKMHNRWGSAVALEDV